tara:strand:+ start:853 stop:1092 length:240 start_codon:yes stop_codon:yes gene_type:complete
MNNNKYTDFMLLYVELDIMLELSKKILSKVSFDKKLFKKELSKSIRWLSKKEVITLKIWSLTTFSKYKNTILEVFDQIS